MKLFLIDSMLAAYLKEEFCCETAAVIRSHICWWSIVEDLLVHETSGYLRGGDDFHWYGIGQFLEPIGGDQEIFVTTRRLNELTQDVYVYRR